ncbi:hypothetical protein DUI87_14584 [Hirundo rustica rustica]|uniref:Uncharacterized protein n=1 Tax=Hirundo rustica rustica TaxID=333673 RepID=A0A3M0K571_HIRRU|nr:hypothetical protein DUI87_14584 [Hirundo rustica rustica]
MMECVTSLVGPNGPLSEDVPLEDGGVVKEIRNTASPGLNDWTIIRRHPPPPPWSKEDNTSPKKQLSTYEIEYTFLGYIIQYTIPDDNSDFNKIPQPMRNLPVLEWEIMRRQEIQVNNPSSPSPSSQQSFSMPLITLEPPLDSLQQLQVLLVLEIPYKLMLLASRTLKSI